MGRASLFGRYGVPPNHGPEAYADGISESTTGPIFEQTFTYDARGNVTTLGYPKCLAACTNLTQVPTVTNTYTNGFLSTVSGNALGVVTPGAGSIDYHANGLVSSVGMNNSVTWQQGKASNEMARPASITTSGATNCDNGGRNG